MKRWPKRRLSPAATPSSATPSHHKTKCLHTCPEGCRRKAGFSFKVKANWPQSIWSSELLPPAKEQCQAPRGGGHGDYRTIVFGPSSVQELVDCMQSAFDLADQYRMPVMVLADGFLGQMMEAVILEKKKLNRKLPPKDWALTGAKGREQNIVRSLWLGGGAMGQINNKMA